jgi:hypothetical protein
MWGLSLMVALFIWVFSIRAESFRVTIPVPVRCLTAQGVVLVGRPPDTVSVTFHGDGLELLRFQLLGKPRDMEVIVDLRSVPPDSLGPVEIPYADAMLGDPQARAMVESFQPARVQMSIDILYDRVLPVAVVSHPVPARYMSVSLRQPQVRLTGPASVLLSMDSAYTAPVSSDVRMEQQAVLDLPDGVRADPGTVTARLRNPVPVVQGVQRAY